MPYKIAKPGVESQPPDGAFPTHSVSQYALLLRFVDGQSLSFEVPVATFARQVPESTLCCSRKPAGVRWTLDWSTA